MNTLQPLLKAEGYAKVKFKVSKTQHLFVKAKINGIWGNFILDTGASSSCVGFDYVSHFELTTEKSIHKAAGAGAIDMYTEMALHNSLQIGRWRLNEFSLIVFDLSHVNAALVLHKSKPVHGILGADILLKGHGIIDYYHHYLYLK